VYLTDQPLEPRAEPEAEVDFNPLADLGEGGASAHEEVEDITSLQTPEPPQDGLHV
jgi:hypothetical protein